MNFKQADTLKELSKRGRALIPQMAEAWRRVAEQNVAGFSVISLDQLADVLADLVASLEGSHDRTAPGPFNEPAPALLRKAQRPSKH